jgi:hypothetical protein
LRSINKKIGTWFYDDGAWHLITKDHNGRWVPGGLILDKAWEIGTRMKDSHWELELWKEQRGSKKQKIQSYIKVITIEKFPSLKEGMEYADELFQAFI